MVSQVDGLRSDEGRLPSQLTQDTTRLAADIVRDRSRQEEQDKNTSLFGRAKSALSAIDRPISERLGFEIPEMRGPLDEILNIAIQEGTRPTNYLAALAGGPAAAGIVRAGRGAKGAKLAAGFLQPVSRSRSPVARIAAEGAVVASGRAAGEGAQAVLPESTPTWARVGIGIGAGLAGGIGAAGAVGRAQRLGVGWDTQSALPEGTQTWGGWADAEQLKAEGRTLTPPPDLAGGWGPQRSLEPAWGGKRAIENLVEGGSPIDAATLEELATLGRGISLGEVGFSAPAAVRSTLGIGEIKPNTRGWMERFTTSGQMPFRKVKGKFALERTGDNPYTTPAFLERRRGRLAAETQGKRLAAITQARLADSGFETDEKGLIPALASVVPEVGAPTIRDVAARFGTYKNSGLLTPKQIATLESIRDDLVLSRQGWDEVVAMQQQLGIAEPGIGIDPLLRKDIEPGGFYIPRGTADTEGTAELAIRFRGKRRGDGERRADWKESETFTSEAAGIRAGYTYEPVASAVGRYVHSIGQKTVDQHISNYLATALNESGDTIAVLRNMPFEIRDPETGEFIRQSKRLRGQDRIALSGLQKYRFPLEMAEDAVYYVDRERDVSDIGATLRGINAAFRGVQATGEMSYLGIQNAIGTVANPEAGLRSAKASTQAWLNSGELIMGNYLIDFDKRAVADDMLTSAEWAAGNLKLTGAQTEFQVGGGVLGDLPGIGGFIKRADRGYGVAGDTMRLETANALLKDWKLRNPGRQVPDDIVKSIAESANRISGWTPQRAFGNFGEATQFAPRYLMARVRALGQLASTNPDKRAQAQSLVGKYLALMTTSTVALNELNGEETDFRPFSGKNGPTFNPLEAEYKNPNFMRVRNVAGRDFSLLGGMDALLGLQIGLMSIATNPTGDVQEMIGRSRQLLTAPVVSTGIDWAIEGENFEGEKLTLDSRAGALDFARRIVPFAVPELAESAQTAVGMGLEGDPAGAAGETAAGLAQGFFGGRGTRQTIRERVDRGDIEDFTPDQQFDSIKPQAWNLVKQIPEFGDLSKYDNFYQWYQANASHLKKQFRETGMGEGQMKLEIDRIIEGLPAYKLYIDTRRQLTTQWVVNNPDTAFNKWEKSGNADWGEGEDWRPTKEQRDIMVQVQGLPR